MTRLSVPKERIRVVLTESIHPCAIQTFAAGGYTSVESLPGAPDPTEQWIETTLKGVSILIG